jgi:membrane-associated phospholipid phosphatase
VLGLTLLWVYLRRNDAFLRFRNTVLLANVLGLVGYVLLPTAPPRMFPGLGFVDVLGAYSSVNHSSAAIELASNPYAAMPSLHAADAFVVGLTMAAVVRWWPLKLLWAAWPVWVAFAVVATANHFWLDVVGGAVVALLAAAVVHRRAVAPLARRLVGA